MNEFKHGIVAAFSDIIYKIYLYKDAKIMTEKFFESLKLLLDYDAVYAYLYDEKAECFRLILSNKETENDNTMAKQLGIPEDFIRCGNVFVYKDSDLSKDKKLGESTELFYQKNGFQFGLHMVLSYQNKLVGIINLYRCIGNHDFSYEDIQICNIFKEHLSLRYSKELVDSFSVKYTISEAIDRYGLTPREAQVLKGMLKGRDNYDIGDEMAISVFTIKKHIMNIYKKLDISSRTQLFKKIKENE